MTSGDRADVRVVPSEPFSGSMSSGAEATDEAVLMDGGSVLIRPVRSLDKSDLRAFSQHLSQDSSRYRFFCSRNELPESDMARMLQQDPSREICLVATVREDDCEHIVGIAELVAPAGAPPSETDGTRRMEFAVAVSDEHQGRGIGTLLLERLVRAAHEMNIAEVDADVPGDNSRMLDVFAMVRAAGAAIVVDARMRVHRRAGNTSGA